MQSGGLSYADRMRKSNNAPKPGAANRRAVGHNRRQLGARPPQNRRMPPQQQMQRGPPQHTNPPQQPRKPKQWNPEQLLKNSHCEIFCKVRKVHSGDQLRLQYAFPDGSKPSIDFLLMLDYVMAPRVSRNPNDTEEEAFGFEAREFLRKFLNGAVVRCTWNKNRGMPKDRGAKANRGAALKELQSAAGPNGDLRLARVFGELKCLKTNPKQRYSEAIYKDEKNWIDVAVLMASLGWAKCKRMKDEDKHALWHACKSAQDAATGRQLGLHLPLRPSDIKKHTRNLDWQPSVEALFQQFQNIPIKGIVEDVREGSTIRCEIYMPTGDSQEIVSQMLWVCLSGIQSERMPKPVKIQRMEHDERTARGDKRGTFNRIHPTPNAIEAKTNVERRLLHQDVTITLQNYSKTENKVWGTVLLGQHDISVLLLRQGLSWTEGWSMAPESREQYMQSEAIAQKEKKGRWAAEAPAKRKTRSPESEWVVTQVYNADCVQLSSIKEISDGGKIEDKRAYLAHIKAPRENRQSGEGAADVYAWEAKEFVRKALIGKPIRVKTIYKKQFAARPGEKVAPQTEFVSISYDESKDIAYELVKQGLARVIRTNEMTRADNYFQLSEQNEKASQQKIGVHGDDSKYKEPSREDLTLPRMSNEQKRETKKREILRKSRSLMTRMGLKDNIDLGNQGRSRDDRMRNHSEPLQAVVEYVFGATRMKVRITVDNKMYMIILFLGGIRGMRGQDLNEKERLLQRTSDEWVRKQVQQREDIYVVIESLDKNSNFVGHVLVGSGGKSKNLSFKLLEEGWVDIFIPAARRSKFGKRLINAEKDAKEARIGKWEGYVEIDETQYDPNVKRDPTMPKKPEKHRMEGSKLKANVTFVESATELFVVFTGEKQYDADYNAVTDYMGTVNPASNQIQKSAFKTGDLVAGLFSGAYYRCRISSIRNKDRIHNVRFIDFGNRGPLKEAEILPLERFENGRCIAGANMKTIPALAKRCRLAGLKPPPEKSADYCNSAGTFFAQNAYGAVEIEVLQVKRERKFEVYAVEATKDGINLNEHMVEQGWCRVDERNWSMWGGGRNKAETKYPKRLKTLTELQAAAQTKHHGMYQYGTVDSEDEDP